MVSADGETLTMGKAWTRTKYKILFLCCICHLYMWATTGRRKLSKCEWLYCQYKILTKSKRKTWDTTSVLCLFRKNGVESKVCVWTDAKVNIPSGHRASLAPSGGWTQIWNKVYFIWEESRRRVPYIVTADHSASVSLSHLTKNLASWVSDLHGLMRALQRENKCSIQQFLLMFVDWMTVINGSKFICCLVSIL